MQDAAYNDARIILGDDDLRTINYAVGLAEVLDKSGQHSRAAALYRDALERRRVVLGPNHADTLHSMNRLGQALFMQGEQEEALKWLWMRNRTQTPP